MTPFELLFGVQMRAEGDLMLKQLLEKEFQQGFEENREDLREKAKEQISKVQEENRRTYNLRRRKATQYKEGDLIAIKRTQLGPGRKIKAKFYEPYVVERAKSNETYDVKSVGSVEGPKTTSTCAEYMKPWRD